MKRLGKFLNSGPGLMILGFGVTPAGGTFLNYTIQSRMLDNERSFEMFQIRLTEAKALQDSLLEQTSARSIGLSKLILAAETSAPRAETAGTSSWSTRTSGPVRTWWT